MKTIYIILTILLSINIIFIQNFRVCIMKNRTLLNLLMTKFSLMSNGGLTVQLYEFGTFEIIGKFLLIEASNYNGEKSTVTIIKKKNKLSQIKFLDKMAKK